MSSKLRVTFEKGEAIRYVGHLDILRTFVRGMRRAGIPLKYSEGFNPHAVMTFILPLGVGVTSSCEIVDIMLKEEIPPDLFIQKLNAVMQPGGIKAVSAEYTDEKMPVIEKAEYVVTVLNDGEILREDMEKALAQQEIIVDKKSKKQVKQVNIMEHIFDTEILECKDNLLKLRLVVSAGNTFNIKPTVVIGGLATAAKTLQPLAVMPHREKFLFE